MKIAEKIMSGNSLLATEATITEVKFLLWLTLCKLEEFTDTVDTEEDEAFDIEAMLKSLDPLFA
jgi:hypothetical protein